MIGRGVRIVGLLAVGVLAVAACGSSKSVTTSPPKSSSAATDAAAVALLPASIRSAGAIRVASDIAYAPVEFYKSDGTTVTGFDYDLGQALGAKLGVKVTFTEVIFDSIIPALKAQKYDIVMSAMSDNKDREKTLDFVDYFTAGTSMVVKKGNPDGLKDLIDLCGKTATAEKGTTQIDVLTAEQAECTKAGKPKITVLALPKDTDSLLAVKSGKAVADINDSPVAAYNAANAATDFQAIESSALGTEPYGIGMLKANHQLALALQAALKAVIADGTYTAILTKYGVQSGALTTATLNGATS